MIFRSKVPRSIAVSYTHLTKRSFINPQLRKAPYWFIHATSKQANCPTCTNGVRDVYKRQDVDILSWQKTDVGFKAIINDEYSGLLYESEIFQPLHTGMRMKAYVKQVREDGKIDLLLQMCIRDRCTASETYYH